MSTPAIAATGTVSTGSNATVGAAVTLTPGVPAGVAAGSLIILAVTAQWEAEGADVAGTSASVAATGFTPAWFYSVTTSDSWGAEGAYLLYKYATGADTGTYSVTVNSAASMEVQSAFAVAARVTGGALNGNPFWSTFEEFAPAAQATSFAVPAFTPPEADTLLLGVGQFSNNTAVTLPTGFASASYTSKGLSLSSLAQTTQASTGALTWSTASGDYPAILVGTLVPPIDTGTGAATTAAATIAASGSETQSGAAAIQAPAPTATAHSANLDPGTGSATAPAPTVAATGTQTDAGTGAATTPSAHASAAAQGSTTMATVRAAVAAAAAGTAVARVLFVGDSVLEGEGASTRDNRSTAKFITGARTRAAIAGSGAGMILSEQATQLPDSASWREPLTAQSGLTFPNNWFSTQGRRGADYDTVGDYAEWTVTGTSVDVLALHGTGDGGSLSVSIDGATAQTVATSSGTLTCSVPTRFSFGGSGSHTVQVQLTAGAAAVDGLVVYDNDETAGLTWWDCTHYGYSSADFADGVSTQRDGNYLFMLAWETYQPHLVVDNLTGVADWGANVTLATFEANLTQRLNVYAATAGTPDVILMYTYKLASEVSGTNSLGLTVQNYFDAATTIAASYANVMILDLNAVYPNFASTSGWLASDNGHPSDLGHQAIANALLDVAVPITSDPGTAAVTAPAPGATATGAQVNRGTAAIAAEAPTAGATGAPGVPAADTGTAAITSPRAAIAATGTQTNAGAAAVAVPPLTLEQFPAGYGLPEWPDRITVQAVNNRITVEAA